MSSFNLFFQCEIFKFVCMYVSTYYFSKTSDVAPTKSNTNTVNCHEAEDFVASWDYTLMSISLPS